jgi:hypothetical protein
MDELKLQFFNKGDHILLVCDQLGIKIAANSRLTCLTALIKCIPVTYQAQKEEMRNDIATTEALTLWHNLKSVVTTV